MNSIAQRKSQKQPLIYVPATFVPQAVLPPELHRYADCARYLLHLVLVRSAMRKADKRGFVRLSATYLRRMIPQRQIAPLRAALEQAGVIEIDRQYIRGEKSMGYRLTPPHRQQRITRRRITDRRLATRLREHRSRRQAQFAPQTDIHRYLHHWLDRINIDLPAAMRTIANTPSMAEFAANYETLVELIAQRDWRDHFCRWGRFHSPITRLHRRLRRHLTIDRKPLVNIDVANSQPLLLAKLAVDAQSNFALSPCEYGSYVKNGLIFAHHNGAFPSLPLPSPLPAPSPLSSPSRELKQFIDMCERGTVYDWLASVTRQKRKQAKRQMLVCIMGELRRMRLPAGRAIDRYYPSIGQFIRRAKADHYETVGRTLQSIEAEIVIHGACRRLMTHHPDTPVITIHDSILTTPDHIETVKHAMLAAFAEHDLKPTLRVEPV